MNQVQLFQNEQFKVRAVEKNGEPWFIAKDVCECLGLSNPTESVKPLAEEEKSTLRISEGGPEVNIIRESGLYFLVFRSKKEEAKGFSRWVRSEVLPTIRKTGGYLNPSVDWSNLDNIQKILDVAKEERKKRIQLEEQARKDAPKIELYNNIVNTDGLIDILSFSKIIKIGHKTVFEILRKHSIIFKKNGYNLPYQEFIKLGYFEVKERSFFINEKENIYTRIFITGKGQDWLYKFFKNNGYIEKVG